MSAAKLERLLNLTAALLAAEQPLTAAQIRRRVPGYPDDKASFRRSFERDKDDLKGMGVPISLEPVPGRDPPEEGYRVRREQAFLRDPGLEPDELAALHLAASMVRLDGMEGGEAFWKLGGVAPAADLGGDTEGGGPGPALVASLPADPNLAALFGAVADRRRARFTYRDEDRLVDPYKLDFQRGRWYLTAFDHLRAEERAFRLDRITGPLSVDDEVHAFERPEGAVPGLRLEPWAVGVEDALRARLLIDAEHADAAVTQLGGTATVEERRPDGSIVVQMEVTNRNGFRSFVLGFLDHAEVLEPPELRDEIVAWLHELAGSGR